MYINELSVLRRFSSGIKDFLRKASHRDEGLYIQFLYQHQAVSYKDVSYFSPRSSILTGSPISKMKISPPWA